jgi:antitoxin ParD1/3/4
MARTTFKNISLPPELRRFVDTKVASGRYTTPSEVFQESLRLLEKHDARERQLEDMRRKIAAGIEQLERGETVDGETAFRELGLPPYTRRRRKR